ncbi:MAG: TIGR00730 family Rossman fold protein [Alphaproteobacteria bacterium]
MAVLASLCVLCGSSVGVAAIHREAAVRLGRLMAERDVRLVYGGGRIGLMGVIADAVLAAGGSVIGVIPRHLEDPEVAHTEVTELILVDGMHERKRRMFEEADAFAVLPGGIGTLDEVAEVLSWRLLRLHDKPIVLVDVDRYWAPFTGLIDHFVAAGFARDDARRLFTVVERVDDVFTAVARAAPAVASADPRRL